jgi:hypothetical protein
MIADNGIAILRLSDPTLTSYLPRLLTTWPYSHHLLLTAGKRNIDLDRPWRVNKKDLEDLLVPIFTDGAIPEAISQLSNKQRLDSIVRLLEGRPGLSTPVRFLLEDDLMRLLTAPIGQAEASTAKSKLLHDVVARLEQMRCDGMIHEASDASYGWLMEFLKVAQRLLMVMDEPMGTDRFTGLQAWRLQMHQKDNRFHQAYGKFFEYASQAKRSGVQLAIRKRIEELYDALLAVWSADYQEHLDSIKVTASLSPAVISIGKPTEVILALSNDGALPLRNLEVQSEPYPSESKCALVKPGISHKWPVMLTASQTGTLDVLVHWRGVRMDDTEVRGDVTLGIEVASLRSGLPTSRLERSPYVVGPALDPDEDRDKFFGRQDVIQSIRRALRTEGSSTVILLEGNRRVGKSSLLARLAARELPEEWVPVYANFQKFAGHPELLGVPTEKVFYGIAKEVLFSVSRVVPVLGVPQCGDVPKSGMSVEQRDEFLAKLQESFEGAHPFERLQTIFEVALDAIKPRRLLLMLDEFDKLQEGIESGATSPQVPENLRNLFHSYKCVSGILAGAETIRRLRDAYWNALFGLGIQIKIAGLDEDAARRLVDEMCEKGTLVSQELLRATLEQQEIGRVLSDQLKDDLDELVRLEVLHRSGEQRHLSYRVEIPLFAEWLRKNVDAEACRHSAIEEGV